MVVLPLAIMEHNSGDGVREDSEMDAEKEYLTKALVVVNLARKDWKRGRKLKHMGSRISKYASPSKPACWLSSLPLQ